MNASALDTAFAALADPTRRAIVERLAKQPARVTDVAEPFAMSLNAISKHVKTLERAGLVKRVRTGREHLLVLQPEPLREVTTWTSRFEEFWNDRLDRLEQYLETDNEKE